jgi:hypothetical protein
VYSVNLSYTHKPIENLQSLLKLPKLSSLQICAEDISSFDFLNGLEGKLTSLFLGKTRSKKPRLGVLSKFKKLEELSLHGHTKEIEVISQLTRIKHLSLSGLTIDDFDFLNSFNELDSLSIDLIKCNDFTALQRIRVKKLNIAEIRNLQDLSFISGVKGIQNLCLSYLNKVTSLPTLESNTSIRRVGISDMRMMNDIKALFECENLTDFYFTNDNTPLEAKDFEPLLNLKKLKYVTVGTGRSGKNKEVDKLLSPAGFMGYEYYEFDYQ